MNTLIDRKISDTAMEFADSFRVLIINGPRQSGKTTLLEQLNRQRHGTYVTLDAANLRTAAQFDPTSFIAGGSRPMMIDEIQRGGNDLILAIKLEVDQNSTPGQFILAGSTRFLSTPSISESLAGRAAIVEVWPFAQAELVDSQTSFVSTVFSNPDSLRTVHKSGYHRSDYFDIIARGFYPEPLRFKSARARGEWYRAYVQSIIDTDIREMIHIDAPSNLRQTLQLAAANTAAEFNASKAASDLGVHRTTITKYLHLLETVFLVRQLPAWSRNPHARAVKRSKIHITDTGLAAYLLGVSAEKLAAPVSPSRGQLVETFVVNELAKQASWAPFEVQLHHWRITQGHEVDLLLERSNGEVVGIEVKAAATLKADDFKSLTALRDSIGDDFVHGFVLHTGAESLSFGDRLTALPISALWDR